MTIPEFKKIARLLKTAYLEVEKEALQSGVDILSTQYTEVIDKVREAVLAKHGFTLEEYRNIKVQVENVSKSSILQTKQETEQKLKELGDQHIPTAEEIRQIAHEVAKEYIVPPVVTNQIVRETTIEQPKIIETTRVINQREEYNAKPLEAKLSELNKKVDAIKIPEAPDLEKWSGNLRDEFEQNLTDATNINNMPDIRKMGMGLRQDIDERVIGSSDNRSVPKLTVGYTAPTNPKLYDLWYDLN